MSNEVYAEAQGVLVDFIAVDATVSGPARVFLRPVRRGIRRRALHPSASPDAETRTSVVVCHPSIARDDDDFSKSITSVVFRASDSLIYFGRARDENL